VQLALTGPQRSWTEVETEIARWRAGEEVTPRELGALLDRCRLRVGLVLAQEGKIEVWGVGKRGRPAQLLGSAARAAGVGAIVNERVAAWNRGPGMAPDQEILRETPRDRTRGAGSKPQRWWVYASIIGAVAVGTAIVIANETAEDRQRIEVTVP
jgi:hypothetical protein